MTEALLSHWLHRLVGVMRREVEEEWGAKYQRAVRVLDQRLGEGRAELVRTQHIPARQIFSHTLSVIRPYHTRFDTPSHTLPTFSSTLPNFSPSDSVHNDNRRLGFEAVDRDTLIRSLEQENANLKAELLQWRAARGVLSRWGYYCLCWSTVLNVSFLLLVCLLSCGSGLYVYLFVMSMVG